MVPDSLRASQQLRQLCVCVAALAGQTVLFTSDMHLPLSSTGQSRHRKPSCTAGICHEVASVQTKPAAAPFSVTAACATIQDGLICIEHFDSRCVSACGVCCILADMAPVLVG